MLEFQSPEGSNLYEKRNCRLTYTLSRFRRKFFHCSLWPKGHECSQKFADDFWVKRRRFSSCCLPHAYPTKTGYRVNLCNPLIPWSRRWDSNPRPADYESAALPLSYAGLQKCLALYHGRFEVVKAIMVAGQGGSTGCGGTPIRRRGPIREHISARNLTSSGFLIIICCRLTRRDAAALRTSAARMVLRRHLGGIPVVYSPFFVIMPGSRQWFIIGDLFL